MRSNDDIRASAPMPMPGPSRGYEREQDRRRTRRSRRGSRSSSDALSLSSSSSSSYLEISRWYPSFGRSGGVLNTFFKTPSEQRHRVRRRRSLKKKNRGIFGFGNNSSSSSVNLDMAYGMGFVKKPRSRNFSPRGEHAAGLERSDGRPAHAQRRQTEEEILEIGRKLAKVARDSNREDMRAMGKRPQSQFSAAPDSLDRYSRQNIGGYAASSRGIAPSKHDRRDSSSSEDDEWESASEGEYSSDESHSGLAYGAAVDLGRSTPPKSSVSRQSTIVSARPPEDIRPPDRKSSAVDPRLFGPVNSLRGLINTPCGFGDRNSMYTVHGPSEQRYAGSAGTAESASIEARPLQNVYPVQTSDPARMEAARASGSFVSSPHSSRRPEPIPIQAPKPIAPVPTSMYDEERLRDQEPDEPREPRIRPSENKTFAETALVGAGVAALGAAIMAGRDKGKGKEKERDDEPRQGRHERYGHDDHREEGTVVQDSRRAKELALEKEIERLERVLAERNKAREQRKRDSKQDSAAEPSGSRANNADAERDHERRRRDDDSRYSEPDYDHERPRTSRRVSEPREQPAVADDSRTRRTEPPAVPSSSGIDVFQFQVPDDAFRTRDSPLRTASPMIIDVTPAPSPPADEVDRRSRRDSFEDEMRDAKHIYDESMHSTAPISAVDMAAAIAATDRARRHDEPERGRTLAKTQDLVQESANAYYHARRMAEREVSTRSRSKSADRSVIEKYDKDTDNEQQGSEIVRIVTPPEMKRPQKHKYSEPDADFRFDHLMSPKDLDHFMPQEYQVRDPSAERPRPYLNLVIPTPVPTPTPESQKKKPAVSKSPEPVVEEPKRDVPDVVISPRGEVVEAPQTPTSKRVSWGPSETQQYEVESPDRSSERNSRSYEKPKSPGKSSGWGTTAAAVAGIAAAAALSKKDDEPESSRHEYRARESTGGKSSEGSRSPPSRKVLPKGTAPSRALDEEPEDVPPAPGPKPKPKPASPRSSQMPGAFADDLDFAATLAAGLQDTGFDPNIVIDDAAYRRRDSPPGSNELTGVYMQPFSETVTDLGMIGIDDGSRPARESGYVIGELADTPASERGSTFDWAEGPSRRQSKSEKRRSVGSDDFEVVEEPEKEPPRLRKKEQRKIDKAARSAKIAEEEGRGSQPAEAGEDDWEEASTSRKSKRASKKSKRTSVGWDDADTPVNDRRVSVPVDAFDDLEDSKPTDAAWDEPQKTSKYKRDSKGYDLADDPSDRRERRREERRRSDFYEPVDRDVSSMVSDSRHDDRSNGRGRHQHDGERSVVSAPDGKRDSKSDKRSSKEEKRSSGGLWGLLKGSNGVDGDESKKDNAGTLGAGAGLAGAVAVASVAAGKLASRSDAAEAPSEQEETQHVIEDMGPSSVRREDSPSRGINVFDFQDPEITPRVIKPAIDPQYGDLLPLPPSPREEEKLYFDVSDDLPSLPDSRPATPPGQEKLLPRERPESSQKRPGFATHSRRRSAYETPLKSPSHTAIPISFRMGQRSSIPSSPRVVSNPTSAHQSPAVQTQETFSSPSNKRSPRPPSWDRPTSWDSTREIKPLYLIERSAHAVGDDGEQEHDDNAENTPLPPSRESPAPESEAGGDVEELTRGLETSPLFVNTAVARAAPLGSQESTPKGFTQTDSGLPESARDFGAIPQGATDRSQIDSGLPRSAKDLDTLTVEDPHQSPLLESSYATPTGFPSPELEARPLVQREESTESVSDFSDALDRPAVDGNIDESRLQKIGKGDKEEPSQKADPTSVKQQDKQGYFSSAFSLLPTAGLAGVGALLGRGKHDGTAANVDETPGRDTQQSATRSPDLADKTSAVSEIEARSEAVVTAPSDMGDQGQAPPTAGAGKSGLDSPLDTTESADASVPNDSPAAHMRPGEALPISDLQQIDQVARDAEVLEPEQEAQVFNETQGVLPSSSSQPIGKDLTASPTESTEDMETIQETPADTVDWPEASTSKKKKGKKGKKKQTNSHMAPILVTVEPSAITSSHVQRDTPIEDVSLFKAVEGSPPVFDLTTASSSKPSEQPSREIIDVGIPVGEQPESSSAPYHVGEESESKGLTDNSKELPDSTEASTIPDIYSHFQSQYEEPQVGGSTQRSPSTARLRSSRGSMSPHGSADRYGSPDAFQTGDDGAESPGSASVSARSSTGQKYKKTRSLRSSRRSSLASQGSGHGYEVGLSEVLPQPGTNFDDHTQKTPELEQHSPKQHQAAEDNVATPLEVVGQHVSSQSNVAGERSSAQPEIRDESEVKVVNLVDEPASVRPEPFTGDIQRLESPNGADPQRAIDFADESLLQQEDASTVVNDISPASSQKDEEGSTGDILAPKSPKGVSDVLGLSLSQGPTSASDEAVPPPSEPCVQENLPEVQYREPSTGVLRQEEPEHALHDDLPRQGETILAVRPVEQTEELPSGIDVEQSARGLSSPSSSPSAAQIDSELQQPATIPVPTEDDYSFTTKNSKKNKKKRKSSTVIGGAVQSSGTTTPAELEPNTQPAESPLEPIVSRKDAQWDESPPAAKEMLPELEQLPASIESSGLQQPSKPTEPEGARGEPQESSLSAETEIPVSEDRSPVKSPQTTDPIVLPALDDVSGEVPISELEKSALNPQEMSGLGMQEKSEDILGEDEKARREVEADQIRDEEAEISRLQSKKKLKPKEKTRLRELKANVDRRAEEAAAAAEATSSAPVDIPEALVAESSMQEPFSESPVKEAILPETEDSILAKQEANAGLVTEQLPPQSVPESEEATSRSMEIVSPSEEVALKSQELAETSPTPAEILPQLDEPIPQTEVQAEAQYREDLEETANREAEAALIQDEEVELAKLESKKKPNKKDKVRMKVLRSNAERRAQEADAAAQLQMKEQDTADLETPLAEDLAASTSQFQAEDKTSEPASQETREAGVKDPQSLEDVTQTPDEISTKDNTQPFVEDSFKISEDESQARDIEGRKSQTLNLSKDQADHSSGEDAVEIEPPQIEKAVAEQVERHIQPGSVQLDSVQLPEIHIEDTSARSDPLADETHALDTPQTQSGRVEQPQVEGVVTDPVEMQSIKDDIDMPATQIEGLSQTRQDDPAFEVQEAIVAPGTSSGETTRAPAQGPASISEIRDKGDDNNVSTAGESEQPVITELPQDLESEWPVTSKKSKKDKKKKRKGTVSDGSSQNSGTVTPFFDAGEQLPDVESRGLAEAAPVSLENMLQPGSIEQAAIETAEQPGSSLALEDNAAKDFKEEETTAAQPLESSIPKQQDPSLTVGDSFPVPETSDDNISKKFAVEETTAAQSLESSVPEQQQTSVHAEDVFPAPGNSEEPVRAITTEPEQGPFTEEPEFHITSKKSKKDKKKKRKNTVSEDSPLPSGLATPIAKNELEQPPIFAETPDSSGGPQAVEEPSLPLDVNKEPTSILPTTEESSAAKMPESETIQPVEELYSPHSVTGEPSVLPSTLEEISTSVSGPEPEQLAQDEPEFFITKKSKKDKKRKKTLSGTVTPMKDFGDASLPFEPAEINESKLGSTQDPSLPLVQSSEPEKTSHSDLVEDTPTPMPPEHADERSSAHLAETQGLGFTHPLSSENKDSRDQQDRANRPGRKSDGWGFLAGAITGASVAAAVPENFHKSPERDALSDEIPAGQSLVQTVETDTDASSRLNFPDVVETATVSYPNNQEQIQNTDTRRDLPQSSSIMGGERGQSDDTVQEPEPIHVDTVESIISPEESHNKEPASLDLDSIDVGSSSTQQAVEKDIKHEGILASADHVQEPRDTEEMIADLQEEEATNLEPQPQVDDWTQASSSKKKKKKDKERKSSGTPWSETESVAHTPVNEEPSEARNLIIDTNERLDALDAGDLTRPQDDFAMQLEPDSKADKDEQSALLGGQKVVEQSPLEDVHQPRSTESSRDTTATPVLHSTLSDRDDTFITTGDQASENVPTLTRIQEEIPTSETVSASLSDSKVDDRDETLITATPLHSEHEELPISSDQLIESADRSQDYHGYASDFDPVSTEAFATPMDLPSAMQRGDPWSTPGDDQPLELSVARDSSNDSAQIGADLSRSLDPEPESSASVPRMPAELADVPAEQSLEPTAEDFWEPIPKKLSKKDKRKAKKGSMSIGEPELTVPTPEGDSQQISKEPAEVSLVVSPDQTSPILGQRSEPVTNDVDKNNLKRSLHVHHPPEAQLEPSSLSQPADLPSSVPIDNDELLIQTQEEEPAQEREVLAEEAPVLTRKMSKKEKRKVKKAAAASWEDDVFEPSQPQSLTPETQEQHMPTTSSPILVPESGTKKANDLSHSAEPQLAQEVAEGMGPSAAKDAAAEDEWAIPISRKKSKKDKKKKGKQSSSGSVSGTQTPAVEEDPILRGAETVETGEPFPEHPGPADRSIGDVGGPEGRSDPRSSENNTSLPDISAGVRGPSDQTVGEPSTFRGHNDHRSAELYLPLGGAIDEVATEPSRDASALSHHNDHRSAELHVPGGQRNFEAVESDPIEDDWDNPSEDGSKKDNKASSSLPDKTPTLRMPREEARHTDRIQNEASGTNVEGSKFLWSPDGRGKELKKWGLSPDLWDDEDYFKPKPVNLTEPTQEPFSKFDIHPAVARGFAANPDRRVGEERPLVGLGLIHRHSSIFQEDNGHVPKLLTMTSDNLSTDSVAVQEAEAGASGDSSQLGAPTRSITIPARPSSSRSYDSLSPSPARKEFNCYETGPAQGSNVPLARSVSPDKFNNLRPVSPGLPKSPQLPPSPGFPRSPQFPPSPGLPRSPQYPPRESSSFEDTRDLAKKGSVAALAERFGGSRKATGKTPNVSDYVDRQPPQEDDLFDEPAMWEGAQRRPIKGSRLDVDSGDFWATPDTDFEEEQSDPDTQNSGQGAAAASHGREPTTPGSDNVSEPRSQPDLDSGAFTPQIPDQANREAAIPLESMVVESPVLGSQPSVEFPTDEQQPWLPPGSPQAGTSPPESNFDVDLHEFLDQPQDPSTPRSRSPALEKISSVEELRPTTETREDDVSVTGPSVVDFSRSLPRVLPSVQEEPHEEEAESRKHGIPWGPRAVTPDINRDSGVVTGSPVPPRVHHFESEQQQQQQQQRDSGVHMRDPSGASPRLLGSRAFSPQPARLSHSSFEDAGANVDDKSSKRSSTAESETQRRFREATPILEARDAPITPEPRKNKSKSRKYPDLGPSPGKAKAAAALAGGGALLAASAARSRSPSPSPSPAPSPAASQRSVSDVTDELRSSALPRQRRAASSNTGISRSRTPEPLSLRAESPSMLRYSGTPPLRSRRTRSGDLRSLSQLSNRSHSDLGAQASSSPASAANNAPAHLPTTPTPASGDLRRATTPAVVAQQGITNAPTAPTANEGRVRSKDMADVYVSHSFIEQALPVD